MTRIRTFGALTLAAPLAVGIVAFGPGTAAQAEGSGIKSPADKAVITKGATTTVTAHLDWLATGKLFVDGPGSDERQIASGTGPKDISNTIGITRNGVYVVKLKGLLGQTIDQQTFSVRVPPARPSGVDAGLSGNKLVVRWERGSESDLTGYDVFVGRSRVRQGTAGALCGENVCSTALSVPASGGRADVGVRALRPDGAGHTIASKLSTASVLLPVSAAPSSRGLPGLPPQSANPLIPLEGRSPLSLPTVAPNGATPGFQYPTPAPQVATPPAANPNAQTASSSSPLRWGRSVAVAIILLLVAAHLAMWTRRLRLAQAAESTGTPPPTPKGRERGPKATDADKTETPSTKPSTDPSPTQPGARRSDWPPTGSLIDAKRPVADAAILGAAEAATHSTLRRVDDAASVSPPPSRVAAAGAVPRSRTTAQDLKARTQPKAKRSRNSSTYRGRRRAD